MFGTSSCCDLFFFIVIVQILIPPKNLKEKLAIESHGYKKVSVAFEHAVYETCGGTSWTGNVFDCLGAGSVV